MARSPFGINSDSPNNYPKKFNNREKKLAEAIREDKNINETFKQALIMSNMDNADGTIYTGAAAEVLAINTGSNIFEVHQAAVATPAVVTPYVSSAGLVLKPVAAADALELTNGITSRSKAAYTVGSFQNNKTLYLETTLHISDISDVTELAVGFRLAAAYQTAVNSYDTYATFNIGTGADGRINIENELNGGGETTTNTTNTALVDDDAIKLRVEVENNGKCKFYLSAASNSATAATALAAADALSLASPTVDVQNFSFESGDVIIPFMFMDTEAGDPIVTISKWVVGYK